MDSLDGLKIYGFVKLISGGYDKEDVGSDHPSLIEAQPRGEFTSAYWYRDSNLSPGTDAHSTQVKITIKEQYTCEKTANNSFHVEVEGYLTSIVRGDKRGTVSATPGRTIEVWGQKGSVFGPRNTNPSISETIFSGNTYLGKRVYDIKAGESTPLNDLSVEVRNYTTGYWNGISIPSPYLDQLKMGLMFTNELPEECDPPVLMSVSQTDDICENEVEACFTFAPCSCEGMALVFQYHFDGESWADAEAKGQVWQGNASNVGSTRFCLQHLPPTNHTWAPVILYWRAKYIPVSSDMPETDWVEGDVQMIFILHPHETVPDISPEECSRLKRGELIGKYEEETCYNEFSCADMNVSNPSRDKDVENCKKINGVA